MRVKIRAVSVEDATSLSLLNSFVQAIHHEALPERFKPKADAAFTREAVGKLLENQDHIVLLAEIGSAAAGYVYAEIICHQETAFAHTYKLIHIHHISVHPDYRGFQVGKALMNSVQQMAIQQGVTRLTLERWSFNSAAGAFFKAAGFTTYKESMSLDLLL